MKQADVLIIGSGIAALQLIHHLSRDLNVIVLTKSKLTEGNSPYAQGGIAAAIDPKDSSYNHYMDTMIAGRHSNNSKAVVQLTKEAPHIIEELLGLGCQFDLDEKGVPLLGMEGSHSHHRIVHGGGDQTGRRIVECLRDAVGENVSVFENMFVYDLIKDRDNQCCGVRAIDLKGEKHVFHSPHTVLATGGCGQLYSYSSNAPSATGDGLALAYRAGAYLIDMEFIQFHPTLLTVNGETKGLVSEAVRGEGGYLTNELNERIMQSVHPLEDLAPRHIVAQTIFNQLEMGHSVFLNIEKVAQFNRRFPTITKLCEDNGIDLEKGRIPVTPGSHFLMGGVQTDERGATSIKGLYAIGEVAGTGVHGANRLASNSLLEGLVYGKRLGQYLSQVPRSSRQRPTGIPAACPTPANWPTVELLQNRMMRYAGIVRSKSDLQQLKGWLEGFHLTSYLHASLHSLSRKELELLFMLTTSWLITSSALQREESRGGHFRSDFPVEKHEWVGRKVIHQKGEQHEYIQATASP